MPGAVVVDDVGDHELGIEVVDDPGQIRIGRVHPGNERQITESTPFEDPPHVVRIPLASRKAEPPGEPSAVQERLVANAFGLALGKETARVLSHDEPALVCGRCGSAVHLIERFGRRRIVEVDDRSHATRTGEVLDEHVLPAAVDARVVLLPEHDDVEAAAAGDLLPAPARNANGRRSAPTVRSKALPRDIDQLGEPVRGRGRRVQQLFEHRGDDATGRLVAVSLLEDFAPSTRSIHCVAMVVEDLGDALVQGHGAVEHVQHAGADQLFAVAVPASRGMARAS